MFRRLFALGKCSLSPLCVRSTICGLAFPPTDGHAPTARPNPAGGAMMSITSTTNAAAKIYETTPRTATLPRPGTRQARKHVDERDRERRRSTYVPALASRQYLTGRDDNVTVQSVRIKFQIHFGIERARQIALYNHASKPLLPSYLYPGSELLAPIKFD
jgi:hypothetical protein